jgi:hypothetical protein
VGIEKVDAGDVGRVAIGNKVQGERVGCGPPRPEPPWRPGYRVRGPRDRT